MFKDQPMVQAALSQRNETIAEFWLAEPSARAQFESALIGRTVIVVDAEDAFTEMLAQQLAAIGLLVTIRKCSEPALLKGNWDLVVMGPGPGDPRNMNDQRIVNLRMTLASLLAEKRPFLAVCLSHQILCLELGLELVRRVPPNQGVQCEIDFFGTRELVGFYNTFVAKCDQNRAQLLDNKHIEVSRDFKTNEVHSLRGPHFVSMQFHAESLLTRNGINIIASSVKGVMGV